MAARLMQKDSFTNICDYFMTEKQLAFADVLGIDPSKTLGKGYVDGNQVSKFIQAAVNDKDAFVLLYPGEMPARGLAKKVLKECDVDFKLNLTQSETLNKLALCTGGLEYRQMYDLFFNFGVRIPTFKKLNRYNATKLLKTLEAEKNKENKPPSPLAEVRSELSPIRNEMRVGQGSREDNEVKEGESVDSVSVYMITCSGNGRIYVGKTGNLHRRFKQHMKCPVKRMSRDVQFYCTGSDAFVLKELARCSVEMSAVVERYFIELFHTTGVAGYNNLKGHPPSIESIGFCVVEIW